MELANLNELFALHLKLLITVALRSSLPSH